MSDSYAAKPVKGGAAASLARLSIEPSELPAEIRQALEARAQKGADRLELGRYVVIGELGRGGMGVVYDAWDPRIERRVAIKTIEPDLVPDPGEREEVIERFLREIKVVGKLQHPGIVTIFDYGEEPELHRGDDPYAPGRIYYYVMEYLQGRPLAHLMRERRVIPDVEAVAIALDIAEALEVAHARGIIHRDIKPSNILLKSDQHAVLLDFGIAKTRSPALTRQGQILGTPTYIAPERLREKEIELDGRADLFSLGVLLYTMLVGEAPFIGDNVYDLLDKIVKQDHPKLARTSAGGVALSSCLDRMLAKDRTDRFETARDASRALREIHTLLSASAVETADLKTPSGPLPVAPSTKSELPLESLPAPRSARPYDPASTRPDQALSRETRRMETLPVEIWEEVSEPQELRSGEYQLVNPVTVDDGELPDLVSTLGGDGAVVEEVTADETEALRPEDTRDDEPAPRGRTQRDLVSLRDNDSNGEQVVVRAGSPIHSEQITELAETLSPLGPSAAVRRRGIEASLVDEEEVVVKPGSLDELKPDELPTHTGYVGAPSVPTPRATEPAETDIVRPRKITAKDPAEAELVDPALVEAPVVTRREGSGVKERVRVPVRVEGKGGVVDPSDDPLGKKPESAAVARKTFGVPKQVIAPKITRGLGRTPVSDIHVSGTNLDRPVEWQRMRKRAAMLLGAGLFAIAVGILLGRFSQPRQEPIRPIVAPEVTALQGSPSDQPPLLPPKSVATLYAQAKAAFEEGRFGESAEGFAQVMDAAPRGSELLVQATLGKAHALNQSGAQSEARKLYQDVLGLRTEGFEAEQAKAVLSEMNRQRKERDLEPKDPGSGVSSPRRAPERSDRPERSERTERAAPSPPLALPPAPTPTVVLSAAPNEADLARLPPSERCQPLIKRYLGDPEGAIRAFEALKALAPETPCVFRQLGVFYSRTHQPGKALLAYRKYLELSPNAEDRRTVENTIANLMNTR